MIDFSVLSTCANHKSRCNALETQWQFPEPPIHSKSIKAQHLLNSFPAASTAQTTRMVLIGSTMLPLGTIAPDFTLPEPRTGKAVSLSSLKRPHGILVAFICNHCPYVKHIQKELGALGRDLPGMGIGMVGVSSNDIVSFPEDGAEGMRRMAGGVFSSFPYLLDESQEVAKMYRAACTPDLYLFDGEMKLVYRGQLDDARPGNGKAVDGASLRAAARLVADGKKVPAEGMRGSIGCSIKWRAGNAPDYFG